MKWNKVREFLKYPIILVITLGLTAIAVSGVHTITKDKREGIAKEDEGQRFKRIFPEADRFEHENIEASGGVQSYKKAKVGKETVGYIIEGESRGYRGPIKIIVGVNPNFTVRRMEVVSQHETPDLGGRLTEILSKSTDERSAIERPWFEAQFDNASIPSKLKDDGGTIEAITGATVSSQAVCTAVNRAVERLKVVVKK